MPKSLRQRSEEAELERSIAEAVKRPKRLARIKAESQLVKESVYAPLKTDATPQTTDATPNTSNVVSELEGNVVQSRERT